MNALINVVRASREHPLSIGQTYLQHFKFSACMSIKLLQAAVTAMVHAFIPGVFQTNTSRAIDELHTRMHRQTGRQNEE